MLAICTKAKQKSTRIGNGERGMRKLTLIISCPSTPPIIAQTGLSSE